MFWGAYQSPRDLCTSQVLQGALKAETDKKGQSYYEGALFEASSRRLCEAQKAPPRVAS